MSLKHGFTLIELMVAVSIFATVAVIATGAVLTANTINQKVQAIKLAMDNLNFALDSMTLKLKHGGEYNCITDLATLSDPPSYPGVSQDCTGGGVAVAFRDADPISPGGTDYNVYIYKISSSHTLELATGKTSDTTLSSFRSLTMSELSIDGGTFYVVGSGPGYRQPRVLISLHGHAVVGHQSSDFAIETTVSDRR